MTYVKTNDVTTECTTKCLCQETTEVTAIKIKFMGTTHTGPLMVLFYWMLPA